MVASLMVAIGESGCMGTCSICDALGRAVWWFGGGMGMCCAGLGVGEDERGGSCQSTGWWSVGIRGAGTQAAVRSWICERCCSDSSVSSRAHQCWP